MAQTIIPESAFKPSLSDELKERYPLRKLCAGDLVFTGGLEDDRINVTAKFADYDWLHYEYDTKFPTKKIGTLSVRFADDGVEYGRMYVRQYLPSYLTGLDENVYIDHTARFDVEIFARFMKRDLEARIKNMDSEYAYDSGKLMLDFFNTVLANSVFEEGPHLQNDIEWRTVYVK